MTSQIDISQITDADIDAWFKEKVDYFPNHHAGYSTQYAGGSFCCGCTDPKTHETTNAFGATWQAAVAALRHKLSSPQDRAEALRAKAEALYAEAEALSPRPVANLRAI